MGRIFIVTTGLTGILNASLELARRLEAAGHETILSAPRPIGERVRAEGFAAVELPPINLDPAPPFPADMSRRQRIWRRFRDREERRRQALDSYRPRAFVAALKKHAPDLVLIDVELHAYIFAAYAEKVNFVLLSQWYSLWRRPGLPYLLTDVIPGVGEEGTPTAINRYWDALVQERKWKFRKQALLSFGTDRRSTLLALAREYGFPRETIRENFWPGVFTYDRFPVIAMAPLEMEFPHDPRPHLHYVGPMVHAGRKEKEAVSGRGVPMGKILEAHRLAQTRLILCTVSTLHAGDLSFLQKLLLAVTERPDWTLIVGLGGKIAPEDLGIIPPNVHTFAYVPQLRVLAAADLSINHGGIHTIHECLHFGVPMLVYSGKRSDQPGCAARVHYHGVGLMADKDLDPPGAIRHNIERLLTEDSFRQNTQAMQARLTRYATSGVAEHLADQFILSPPNLKEL